MREYCGPPDPELLKVYEELEKVVKKILVAEGRTYDIMTDWVLITAQTELHQHNDSHAVGWTSAYGQPVWKTKGLMQECLDNIQAANIARNILPE